MANHTNNPEAHKKKTTPKESVDSFIGKKHAEKEAEVSESVAGKVAGTKEAVEVIVGAEKPKEKVSERAGEKGEGKGPTGGGQAGAAADEAQAIAISLKDYHFPSEEIMVKKIRTAINAQIAFEWKKAKKFRGNIGGGGADGYNKTIAKIRELKQLLSTLFSSTFSFLKNMYVKYFTPDGKRRKMDEI